MLSSVSLCVNLFIVAAIIMAVDGVNVPFHAGELEMQDSVSARAHSSTLGYVRHSIEEKDALFLEPTTYITFSMLDDESLPFVSMLFNDEEQLLAIVNNKTIRLHFGIADQDPLNHLLHRAAVNGSIRKEYVSFHTIDLGIRRSRRVNGFISNALRLINNMWMLEIRVDQIFGNCPKYIQSRTIIGRRDVKSIIEKSNGEITPKMISLIRQVDFFMLSTRYIHYDEPRSSSGLDLSHKGGRPGFVQCVNYHSHTMQLVWQDYRGNKQFLQMGNLMKDDRIGALMIDYDSGAVLQMVGRGRIITGSEADALIPRAGRVVLFTPERCILRDQLIPYTFGPVEYSVNAKAYPVLVSPFSVDDHPFAAFLSGVVTLVSKVKHGDSGMITFMLKSTEAMSYLPGQYIILSLTEMKAAAEYKQLKMNDAGSGKFIMDDDLMRSWTISSSPPVLDGEFQSTYDLTITTKLDKKGITSPIMHDEEKMVVGQDLLYFGIEGSFTVFKRDQPIPSRILFLAGGVGVTPFISMARGLRAIGSNADVLLFWSTGYCSEIAIDLACEMASLNVTLIVSITREATDDVEAALRSHSLLATNRIRVICERISRRELLRADGDMKNRSAYICGPKGYISAMENNLIEMRVPAEQIHKEHFSF